MLELGPSGENFSTMFSKWTIPVYEANINTKYYQVNKHDQPWYEILTSLQIEPSEADEWKVYRVEAKTKPGIHALDMVFYGEGKDMFVIDWLRFD